MMICMRTSGRILLSIAILAGSVGAVGAPASAALPGLEFIEVRGGEDVHLEDSVWDRCPEGKQALGGGFNVVGSGGEVAVHSMWPGWPGGVPDQLRVSARQADPYNGSWELFLGMFCAPALPGFEIVAASSAVDSVEVKAAEAFCPKGKQLLGTGFAVLNGNGEIIVEDVIPNGDAKTAPTSVYVRAYEEGAFLSEEDYPEKWRITAYAVCVNTLKGLVRVTASTSWSNEQNQSVTVACPAAKSLVGTGFEVHGSIGRVVVTGVIPWFGDTEKLEVEASKEDPFDTGWYLDGYAICV